MLPPQIKNRRFRRDRMYVKGKWCLPPPPPACTVNTGVETKSRPRVTNKGTVVLLFFPLLHVQKLRHILQAAIRFANKRFFCYVNERTLSQLYIFFPQDKERCGKGVERCRRGGKRGRGTRSESHFLSFSSASTTPTPLSLSSRPNYRLYRRTKFGQGI